MAKGATRDWDALQDDSMLEGDVLPRTANYNEYCITNNTLEA